MIAQDWGHHPSSLRFLRVVPPLNRIISVFTVESEAVIDSLPMNKTVIYFSSSDVGSIAFDASHLARSTSRSDFIDSSDLLNDIAFRQSDSH